MRITPFVLPLCIGTFCAANACSHRTVRAIKPVNVLPDDNSYLDLKPGGTLRVLVPLKKATGTPPSVIEATVEGKTISGSIPDFAGYEVSYYAIKSARGLLKLKFQSAEITRHGKTVPAQATPELPFKLPRGRAHIRLIYLIRASHADHNMAIVAAKHLAVLNAFTKQVKANPTVCGQDQKVFCTWVPSGVAVRPEGS